MSSFKPKIIAFCCYNCAYAAADLAGTMRLQYDPCVSVIGVPCTGAIDLTTVLTAFEEGADGVFIAGCLKGECHYKVGNLRALERVKYLKRVLSEAGIDGDRLEMYFLSAAMGSRFAEIAKEMTDRIRGMGPLPLNGCPEEGEGK
ncbi:MAG: hydrogenase iron-sulfur subunit [Peptococcaceae bacterium]|nr:hydrogenase iron-sulfur subunit [Peptococcaceae bacterium]